MSKRSPKSVSEKIEIVLIHLEEGKSLGCRELWCLQRNLKDLTEKQGSSCYYIFRSWIKDYTSSKELKAAGKGMVHMKQGCKITYEERAEIVNDTSLSTWQGAVHCRQDKDILSIEV